LRKSGKEEMINNFGKKVSRKNIKNVAENNMENLEQRIQKIEDRNKRVEVDKAWETSWARRILLAIFTYLAIGVYLWIIEIPRPWINAIVPTVAFMISTFTMPWFKKIWLKFRE
jgi:polyferredoxin